ncbi:PP2C family protein-serine/threonine phosphatase [Lentzea californiensis]|uniref:PP2C family protein-serine/threonine phosphatase n=1 Tax=Lentzea californiensis TaxID=438851 RepID=UPI002166A80C|nr:protein phosphatase 2C domain-containing protein [Lentzea californiensis]MCR3753751.1 protein phosphatase [Lentzea californiensis]
MTVISTGVTTHPGVVREANEDDAIAGRRVFAVADGVGGHAAGEVASALVIARLRELDQVEGAGPEDVRAALADARRALQESEHGGMTTAAGIALVSVSGRPHWVVFNIGDSRVYRLDGVRLAQLTVDHSEAQELVAAGLLTEAEVRTYPRRNVVTRVLGDEGGSDPDMWLFPPCAGERFLICTDGLTNEVSDDGVEELLRRHAGAREAAAALVELAVTAGARDNVTAVVVDYPVVEDVAAASCDTAPRIPR